MTRMKHQCADIHRRRLLLSFGAGIGLAGMPRRLWAQAGMDLEAFLQLSAQVTGHDRLDPELAAALLDAWRETGADTPIATMEPSEDSAQRRALLKGWYMGRVAPDGIPQEDSEDLERAQGEDGEQDDETPDIIVGYEATLMGRVVADLIPLRSYCGGRPHYWTDPPDDPERLDATE